MTTTRRTQTLGVGLAFAGLLATSAHAQDETITVKTPAPAGAGAIQSFTVQAGQDLTFLGTIYNDTTDFSDNTVVQANFTAMYQPLFTSFDNFIGSIDPTITYGLDRTGGRQLDTVAVSALAAPGSYFFYLEAQGADSDTGNPTDFVSPDYRLVVTGDVIPATPEPSQAAGFGLGVLGLAGLALKARRRASATV